MLSGNIKDGVNIERSYNFNIFSDIVTDTFASSSCALQYITGIRWNDYVFLELLNFGL